MGAIDSALGQTYPNIEVVVVDDGSQDETPRRLASRISERLRVIRNKDRIGAGASRNIILAEAAGEYLAWLDADDIAHPDRISIQLQNFIADPHLVIAGAWIMQIDPQDPLEVTSVMAPPRGRVVKFPQSDSSIRIRQPLYNQFSTSAVMLRIEPIHKAELKFEQAFWPAEDFQFWTRVLLVGTATTVPKVLSFEKPNGHSKNPESRSKQRNAVISITQDSLSQLGFNKIQLQTLQSLAGIIEREKAKSLNFTFSSVLRIVFKYAESFTGYGPMTYLRSTLFISTLLLRYGARLLIGKN